MSKQIPLSQGFVAIVDDEDFTFLSQWKWFAVKSGRNFYAASRLGKTGPNRGPYIRMHQLLSRCYRAELKEHRNGNGLDNQKHNLRPMSQSQNIANSKRRVDNKSGFKGVWWCKSHRRWGAKIQCKALGWFSSAREAALAYDRAALKVFGEYANTNQALGLI